MADGRIEQPKRKTKSRELRVVDGGMGFPNSLVAEALSSPEALEELCGYYVPRIYNYILKRVGRVEDAEDLTSVVFEKVVAKLDSFDETRASFSTWIYRIATNCVTDHYRSTGRRKEDPLDERALVASAGGESDLERKELYITLLDLLQQLPPRYREAVALRYFARMRVQEVAETLGITESAASKRILRGLEELRLRAGGGPLEELL